MRFIDNMEFLQNLKENENKVVIARCGVFMQAIGSDAILLHDILGFKNICIKPGVCKVGIPTSELIKCLNKLDELGIGYAIYDYKKENKEIILKYKVEGKVDVDRTIKRNCNECEYYKTHYKSSYENIDIFEVLKQRENNNE